MLVRGEQDAKIVLAHQNDQSEIIPEYEIGTYEYVQRKTLSLIAFQLISVLGEDKNRRFSINRNGKYVSREKRDTLLSASAWLPLIVRVYNGIASVLFTR